MPVLDNPKWETFAQALAKGMTQAEAYAKAGYKPSEPNASRLTSKDKVAARLAELQAKAAERTLVTVEALTAELEEARQLAIRNNQGAAAVAASMGKAKLHGHLVDKVEVKHSYSDLSDAELQTEFVTMMAELQRARATAH